MGQMSQTSVSVAKAREEFLPLVDGLRPELHRYCARLTGSVIEGEDIVQETLAKAFYAMSLKPEVPPLRPWLFRIAHNTAIDFLKSHGQQAHRSARPTRRGRRASTTSPIPSVVRAALARFLALPVTQRSAVILKDVLGHSLEETAETMGTTVMAVKAALVRGRAQVARRPSRNEDAIADDRRARRARALRDACSTRATGTACARWSATTAGSIWCRSRSAAARRSACTSAATRRKTCRCGSFGSRASWRSPRTSPARTKAVLLHLARVGGGPREVDPRLPLRALHRARGRLRATHALVQDQTGRREGSPIVFGPIRERAARELVSFLAPGWSGERT